jgi:hypothetical protein
MKAMLEELLQQSVARPASARPRSRPAPRRRSFRTLYERMLAKSALLVALLLAAGVWWVGARFTLDWLRSIGVAVDTVGLLAWSFPLAITALEMGMLIARSRLGWVWLFWGGVLLFDLYTTASGLLLFAEGRELFGYLITRHDGWSWGLAVVVGLFIAVVPEPAMRSIWREWWHT